MTTSLTVDCDAKRIKTDMTIAQCIGECSKVQKHITGNNAFKNGNPNYCGKERIHNYESNNLQNTQYPYQYQSL